MGTQPKSILLVEGNDEVHVVKKLLKKNNLPKCFKIKPKGGIEKLLDSISAEVKAPEIAVLGIVADANDNIENRWRAISNRLDSFPVPNKPSPTGSVFTGPKPQNRRVGIWLMPNNQCSGQLEDFVYKMIPADDSILPLSKKYINNIPTADRKFKDTKVTRAYVHAWLATLARPRPMGLAITTGDLSHEIGEAKLFVKWLRKLFKF